MPEGTKNKYLTLVVQIFLIATISFFVSTAFKKESLKEQRAELYAQCQEKIKKSKDLSEDLERSNKIKGLTSIIMKLQPKLDDGTACRIVESIVFESEKRQLDPILITALIFEESAFDSMAVSRKGAMGLMQVRYEVWKGNEILLQNEADSPDKLCWIEKNIRCGMDIFKLYYEESGRNVVRALHRYHSGDTDLPRGKKYYEIDYVNKVLIRTYEISGMLSEINVPNE